MKLFKTKGSSKQSKEAAEIPPVEQDKVTVKEPITMAAVAPADTNKLTTIDGNLNSNNNNVQKVDSAEDNDDHIMSDGEDHIMSDDEEHDPEEEDEEQEEEVEVKEWDEGGKSHCGYGEGVHETLMSIGQSIHKVVGEPNEKVQNAMDTVGNWFQEASYAARDLRRGKMDVKGELKSVVTGDGEENNDEEGGEGGDGEGDNDNGEKSDGEEELQLDTVTEETEDDTSSKKEENAASS